MNPNKLNFSSKENPSGEEIIELRDKLRAFNRSIVGDTKYFNLMCLVRDDSGKLLGGIYGKTSWEWLYIEYLWVDESLRGKGIGSSLIKKIEKLANERNIFRYYLNTASFQALDFYIKLGYVLCGEIDDFPPGHKTYYLKKTDT